MAAFRFELTRVQTPAVRERVVAQFSVARMVDRTERALDLAIRGETPEAIAREIGRC